MLSSDPVLKIPEALSQRVAAEYPFGEVTVPITQEPGAHTKLQPLLHLVRALQEEPRSREQRLRCLCQSACPALYVRKGAVSGTLFLARMPGTGHLHDRTCWFYQSALPDYAPEAISQEPSPNGDDQQTSLRVSFSFGPCVPARPQREAGSASQGFQHSVGPAAPKTSVNPADFLRLMVHWSGLSLWRRGFAERHRFEAGGENPFCPIFDRLLRTLRTLRFKGKDHTDLYMNVGRGIYTKKLVVPSQHIRIDVIDTIAPPSEGRLMGQITLFGSGEQFFFLPPHLLTKAANEIPLFPADPAEAYTANLANPRASIYALAVLQVEAVRTQRSPCCLKVSRMEILPMNYLGMPIADETQLAICDQLISERRDFLRPLIRDEETAACCEDTRLPFLILGIRPHLRAGEIATAEKADLVKKRYESAGKTVEIFSPRFNAPFLL